ncbi:MAG TPA: hypothetical protein P5534_12835, partial [Candidatus Paceibacterota bacterium]|nr:hypothetical protein [Candidatus Paceibacterota bacterium]
STLSMKAPNTLPSLLVWLLLSLLAPSAVEAVDTPPPKDIIVYKTQAGLTLSRRGVLVTAFGEDPDGQPGTLLRVWEQGGLAGPLTVTLPAGLKVSVAQPVTLRGETTGGVLPISGGQLTLDLKAYAPVSHILR